MRLLIILMLLLASVTDIKNRIIPNYLTITGMVVGLLVNVLLGNSTIDNIILMVIFFFVGTLNIMGMGDIKLFMCLSAIMGTEMLYTLIISMLCMTLCDLMIIKTNNKLTRLIIELLNINEYEGKDRELPVSPFVFLAYILWIGVILLC